MDVVLSNLIRKNDIVAVATSGGVDSMVLLHYLTSKSKELSFKIVALNIEHGIRGQDSIDDSNFVKTYCMQNNIPLLFYKIDTLKKAEQDKLSVEQAGRILRYQCYNDALQNGKCNKIATAHHLSDQAESVLFNIFRGTGIKGLAGISENFCEQVIRPFINVTKQEILTYAEQNNIDYVTDKTNFDDAYTRNFIRLNIVPEIKKVFPELENSLKRLSDLAKLDEDYLQNESSNALICTDDHIEIPLGLHDAIFSRCVITALQKLGLNKDWEKIHIDSILQLQYKNNGAKIFLPKNIIAVKEYGKVVLYTSEENNINSIPFSQGIFDFANSKIVVEKVEFKDIDLKNGHYIDASKLSPNCVIRSYNTGDVFTKFGGGTKKLCDYFTDKKIPQRLRNSIPLLADGNDILAIFGVEISQKVKLEDNLNNIYKLTYKKQTKDKLWKIIIEYC